MTSLLLVVLSGVISRELELVGGACILVSVVSVLTVGTLGVSGGPALSMVATTGRSSVNTVVTLGGLFDVGTVTVVALGVLFDVGAVTFVTLGVLFDVGTVTFVTLDVLFDVGANITNVMRLFSIINMRWNYIWNKKN